MPALIRRWQQGEPLGATRLNETVDVLNELAVLNAGVDIPPTVPDGYVISLEIKSINVAAPTEFPFRYLTCTLPGMTATGGAREFSVWLPAIYTEASRGSITYTYTDVNNRQANDGATTEDQQMTPELLVGEQILAAELSEESRFQMIGDGRMWAKVTA